MLDSPKRTPTPLRGVGLRHKDRRSEALNVEPTVQGSNSTCWNYRCPSRGPSRNPVAVSAWWVPPSAGTPAPRTATIEFVPRTGKAL